MDIGVLATILLFDCPKFSVNRHGVVEDPLFWTYKDSRIKLEVSFACVNGRWGFGYHIWDGHCGFAFGVFESHCVYPDFVHLKEAVISHLNTHATKHLPSKRMPTKCVTDISNLSYEELPRKYLHRY